MSSPETIAYRFFGQEREKREEIQGLELIPS
jgi:hypothetical protein